MKQRTWHAGKPKKKPDFDPALITEELLNAVVEVYEDQHPSLQAICDRLSEQNLNPLKVRKLLITAGVYESSIADKVMRLREAGKSIEDIMRVCNLSRASVQSYLPYSKIIYKMEERSVSADRQQLYRKRKKAVQRLQEEQSGAALWDAVTVFAGYPFETSRGLAFTYCVKGGEIFVDRKEKSITRSTVEMAYERTKSLEGVVTGPKKIGVFGASYIYPIFIRLGVINVTAVLK